jgi:hypothetical protein
MPIRMNFCDFSRVAMAAAMGEGKSAKSRRIGRSESAYKI